MINKLDWAGVGIASYGTYLPRLAIKAEEIEAARGKVVSGIPQSLGVQQKTVPERDEDTTTLAVAAAAQALERWSGEKEQIGALMTGSESHAYAVKPTGTMVKSALNLSDDLALADLQFACKAGTQAIQIGAAYVKAGLTRYALAIGADTAQSRPGDVLEFTAAAGAAAYILGNRSVLAELIATTSVATDTPDFWRRPGQNYPQHAGRLSGEPAYFKHVMLATKNLLAQTQLAASAIDYCVFHTPNAKFPVHVATELGFTITQLTPSLVVPQIGNTYAAASLIALAAVLDVAQANQLILLTSYGSGAGADSFLFRTTPLLVKQRHAWRRLVRDDIRALRPVTYSTYLQNTAPSPHEN